MRIAILCTISFAIVFPFAVSRAAAEDKPAADTRLDRRVTIQCVDVRLHTVIEQLSKLTGVRLNCGRNKDDWQVRDIPAVVCAKDIPLGKLLRAVAGATHLTLTSQKTESGRSYRIWRTPALVKELADYEEKKRAWRHATAAWEWDVVAELKDVPDSAFAGLTNNYARRLLTDSGFKEASPILAALGPEARDKVLGGEPITIKADDAPDQLKPLIDSYLRSSSAAAYRDAAPYSSQWRTPTEEDFQNSTLVIERPRVSEDEGPSITVRGEGSTPFKQIYLSNITLLALIAKDHLPKQPEDPKRPRIVQWNPRAKIWQTEITLKAPKDKDRPTFSDLCVTIAEATGYAVVAENFHGHQEARHRPSDL